MHILLLIKNIRLAIPWCYFYRAWPPCGVDGSRILQEENDHMSTTTGR